MSDDQITSFAVQACPSFTPSRHGNAHPTGPQSLCVQCHKPQSQHWVRALLSEVRELRAQLQQTHICEHAGTEGECQKAALSPQTATEERQ